MPWGHYPPSTQESTLEGNGPAARPWLRSLPLADAQGTRL